MRKVEIYCKELVPMIMEAGKFMICRVNRQAGGLRGLMV